MVSRTKYLRLDGAVLLRKSTRKQCCAWYRLETTSLTKSKFFSFLFFDGEPNLKSEPQIVYALWLSTIFLLCPRDTQLHQTGETNRIGCKQSVCSCCVVEYVLGWWSSRFYACACPGFCVRVK